MKFLRTSALLSVLIACHLQLKDVLAESLQQQEAREAAYVRSVREHPLKKKQVLDGSLADLLQSGSVKRDSGYEPGRSIDEILDGMGAKTVEENAVEAANKRRFDSLGGALIPNKRGYDWDLIKRSFDSLGGGLIPPAKKQWSPASRKISAIKKSPPTKNKYLKKVFPFKARRTP